MSQHPGATDPEQNPVPHQAQTDRITPEAAEAAATAAPTPAAEGTGTRAHNPTERITPPSGAAVRPGHRPPTDPTDPTSPPAPPAPAPAPAPPTDNTPADSAPSGTAPVSPVEQLDQRADITATAGTPKLPVEPDHKAKSALPRFLAVTLGLAAVVIVLLFVKEMQDIIAPIFLGLNLMIVAYPIQHWLAKVMHRYVAAIISLLAVLAVLVAFVWACVWSLVELINALPQYNSEFQALWGEISSLIKQLGFDAGAVNTALKEIKPNDVMGLLMPLLSNVSSIASLLATLVMATFFLAMDSATMSTRLKLLRLVQPRALAVVTDFTVGVRRYWLVTTAFGLIVALADVAALAIIGVPLIWVWGVLSFLTNYIPNIGFVVGVIPPALLALLSGGPMQALAVLIVYCALNFVIQVLVQPKFTGESVGVTPVVSFFSLLFWVFILGPLGALLALPATLLIKALLIDADPNARWLNLFIASSPDSALPDDEQPEPRSPRKRDKVRERKALLRG